MIIYELLVQFTFNSNMIYKHVSNLIVLYLLFPLIAIATRYNYLVFENNELTRKIFIKEFEIVSQLHHNRRILQKQLNALHSNLGCKLCSTFWMLGFDRKDHAYHNILNAEPFFKFIQRFIVNENVKALIDYNFDDVMF